jgi:F0F1-type ATP synthase membrane subunit c/vacuolar-type H+-ATPase subunit K
MRIPVGALIVNELKARLSKLRLFQFAIIASIPMFVWVAELGRDPGESGWTWKHWLVTALVLWGVFGGSRVRHRILIRSEKELVTDVSNPKALKQWESGHILGLAFAESVALWGLVVRMVLGGALWQASIFYAAGFILLLLWTPLLPSGLRSK